MSLSYCKTTITNQIKAEALRLGFSACGVARAEAVEGFTRSSLKEWLSAGKHAGMAYMENHFDKRVDPRLLVEGTQSIVSVALNYFPRQQLKEDQYQFSWYAYGKDYHEVMKRKLEALFSYINECLTPVNGRVFCDTAPVLERYWAWKAGLGWIGKNTQLIIPQAGSAFFLGEVFLDIPLEYDEPMDNRCGNCTNCLDNCPTQALEAPQQLNSCKCLSYLTIENRGDIPVEYASKMGNRIYGCDECQKVCPWNRFLQPSSVAELMPSEAFMAMTKDEWNKLTVEQYRSLFKGSAVKRAKYEGMMRNLDKLKNRS